MIYYSAHPGTTNPDHEKIQFFRQYGIRLMISAAYYQRPVLNYAVDNGAWTDFCNGLPFNHQRFVDTLNKVDKIQIFPDFVVLPDVVAGGLKSLELSKSYLGLCDDYPCYLPVQDGMQPKDIDNFGDIVGIFVGGTTIWKWKNVHLWSKYAHDNGMNCHVGRVGTLINFQRCASADVDSADGSNLIRNGKYHNIPRYLNATNEQKYLVVVNTE